MFEEPLLPSLKVDVSYDHKNNNVKKQACNWIEHIQKNPG